MDQDVQTTDDVFFSDVTTSDYFVTNRSLFFKGGGYRRVPPIKPNHYTEQQLCSLFGASYIAPYNCDGSLNSCICGATCSSDLIDNSNCNAGRLFVYPSSNVSVNILLDNSVQDSKYYTSSGGFYSDDNFVMGSYNNNVTISPGDKTIIDSDVIIDGDIAQSQGQKHCFTDDCSSYIEHNGTALIIQG